MFAQINKSLTINEFNLKIKSFSLIYCALYVTNAHIIGLRARIAKNLFRIRTGTVPCTYNSWLVYGSVFCIHI